MPKLFCLNILIEQSNGKHNLFIKVIVEYDEVNVKNC